ARAINLRQLLMRVDGRGGISGEMFSATGDALFTHRGIEGAGIAHHLVDIFSVTTAAQRIVGVIVERNVEHRTEIEIESEQTQQTSGDIAVAFDKIDISFFAELLRIWRLVADQSQTRHAPAFLIDRDDRLDLAQVAQIVDEFPQLRSALDISTEQNERARLHFAK